MVIVGALKHNDLFRVTCNLSLRITVTRRFIYRQGDQLLEINDMKLEGLTVEKVYGILDKVPPGKVYIKVKQSNTSEKIPLQLNDALSNLQSECQVLDKKMSGKQKSVGTASTLSGASSGSFDSCGRFLLQQALIIRLH